MPETKFTLEPTAAMTLFAARAVYQDNPHIKQYLNKIDLSTGLPLMERMQSVVPHLVEMAENRKYFYHQSILEHLQASDQRQQIIILGAGYDPISVHILNAEAAQVENIIEIDLSSFDAKRAIFKELEVPHLEKIQFVEANVITENVPALVRRYGYADHQPTIITTEGLVYFLSEGQLVELIKSFRSPNGSNFFCIDYLIPWTAPPTAELRATQKNGIQIMEKQAGMTLTVYPTERMVALIENIGGTSIKVYLPQEIEMARRGRNDSFTQKGEGTFEFVTFYI